MDIEILISSKIFIATASALVGIVSAVITQGWLNKRASFSYNVFHNQVGQSADDAIYGSVKVTWNDTPIARLYLSTVELINESSKDFDSILVRVFTNNTKLLTQRTEICDTTRIIEFSDEYKDEIFVPDGEQPTDQQFDLYRHRRDYIVPTMNRGQKVRFELLNAANTEEQPEIWLEILQKGIKCKFRVAHQQFMGVPQPTAALVGSFVGFVATLIIIINTNEAWIAGCLAYLIGLLVLFPGAYTVKLFRKVRGWFAG